MLSFSENRGKYHLVNYKRAKFKKFPNSRIATYPRSELLGWPESLRPCWWLWSSIRSRAGKRCLRLDKSSRTIDHSWWHLGWWWSPWCWEWSDTCRRPSCGCTESPSCWSPCDEENYDTEYITKGWNLVTILVGVKKESAIEFGNSLASDLLRDPVSHLKVRMKFSAQNQITTSNYMILLLTISR